LGIYQLPTMLAAIAWVESEGVVEFSAPAEGRAGLWGLTRDVAKQHGLDITKTPDPRLDAAQSTLAARSYLIELYHRQGGRSWLLAAMAYRQGPQVLDRLKSRRLEWTPESLTFWSWYSSELIPWDLSPYLYKVLAAAVLWEEAEAFGLRPAGSRQR